jgi:hypothetical protein
MRRRQVHRLARHAQVSGAALVKNLRLPLCAYFVEKPWVQATAPAVSEAKPDLTASRGVNRGREGNELRQFPQILGSGG